MTAVIVAAVLSVHPTVDEAILLYENGDIPGAIGALEGIVHDSGLSLDELMRAWDRLGSAYYAMGSMEDATAAYLEILKIDVHYDLSPRANPRLRDLLDRVRSENMATAQVVSSPEGALIALDEELMGVTPIDLEGLLSGRTYTISVYAGGYESQTYTLLAQAGRDHSVSFLLEELPATIDLAAASADTSAASQTSALEEILGTPIALQGGPDEAAQSATTADLVNFLTTSGGGFDMAALASSGALSSQRASSGIAGSERLENFTVGSGTPVQVMTTADLSSMMAFSGTGGSMDASTGEGDIPGSSRTGEEIMEVLAEKRGSVTFIYNKHLRSDPMLMGTVLVEMVIEPSGRVSQVSIIESNTFNPAFEIELSRAIGTWRFGAVDENESPLTVRYPFSFSQ